MLEPFKQTNNQQMRLVISLFFPKRGLISGLEQQIPRGNLRGNDALLIRLHNPAAKSRVLYQNSLPIAMKSCFFDQKNWTNPISGAISEQSPLGEGNYLAITHHHMVNHPHVDQVQRRLQALGNTAVGLARFSHATGMVVTEYDRCAIMG